jgi:hypothetical protein
VTPLCCDLLHNTVRRGTGAVLVRPSILCNRSGRLVPDVRQQVARHAEHRAAVSRDRIAGSEGRGGRDRGSRSWSHPTARRATGPGTHPDRRKRAGDGHQRAGAVAAGLGQLQAHGAARLVGRAVPRQRLAGHHLRDRARDRRGRPGVPGWPAAGAARWCPSPGRCQEQTPRHPRSTRPAGARRPGSIVELCSSSSSSSVPSATGERSKRRWCPT